MRPLLAALAGLLLAAPAADAAFYGVTPTNQLVTFTVGDLAFKPVVQLTGLQANERVADIDVRPQTGGLYGITLNNAGRIRLVRVNRNSGALVQVGQPFQLGVNPGGLGMDIDPVDDRVAVITTDSLALAFDPETGAPTDLADPAGNLQLAGLTYTSYDPDTFSIGIAVSAVMDKAYVYTPGNTSTLELGALGVDATTAGVGLDIDQDQVTWMHLRSTHRLYRLTITPFGVETFNTNLPDLTAFCSATDSGYAFGAATVGAAESDASATVAITRTGPTDLPGRVDWSTVDDSATAGSDYTASGGRVSFAAGQQTATVSVPLVNDATPEAGERFTVRLSSPDGAITGADARVLIADDDIATGPGGTGSGGGGGGGGGGTTTVPAPDTTGPVLLALPLTLKAARTLALPFGASEAGTATVTLKRGRTTLATTKPFALKAGDNRVVLRLSAKQLRALRRSPKVALKATIGARDAAGNTSSRTFAVTVRR